MLEAKRTLVKSAPELWAEVSDPAALARHLAPFGSVTITAARPESVVEWTGEKASGTLTLAASGFGTKVTLQARTGAAEPEPEPAAPEPEPPRPGFWARLLRRPAPEPPPAPPPAPAQPLIADDAALLVLTDMLDALGAAHHRPFSRA